MRTRLGTFLIAAGILGASLSGVSSAHASYSPDEFRRVEGEKESKVRKLREAENQQLRLILGRRLAENRRADVYFRLAENYLEMYRQQFFLEGRVHEGRLKSGTAEKTIDRSASRPYLQLGIDACKQILALRIPYPKMDRVLYFLGFNYGELGQEKFSLAYFRKLLADYPGSEFAIEGHRELGESLYRAKKYREAVQAFEAAVSGKVKSNSLPVLLHRLAWSYYRIKQYSRAIETMKRAISEANSGGEKFVSVREEGLRDMAIFMTEAGKVDEALKYFSDVAGDKDYFSNALERLGKEYERTLQRDKAILVYETILETRPQDEAAFRVVVKLVELEIKKRKYAQISILLKKTKIPKSGGSVESQNALIQLKAMIRKEAVARHQEYRKKSEIAQLKDAEYLYELYIREFLDRDDERGELPEIQMYLAEVKRDLGKKAEAAELYKGVVESGEKRYAKDAASLWVGSLSETLKQKQEKQAGHATPSAGSTESPGAGELEFVKASDTLSDKLPNSNEALEASIRSAQLLAGFSKTRSDAVRRARKVIKSAPSSPQAVTAARLWVQVLAEAVPEPTAENASQFSDTAEELTDAVVELKANAPLMAADQRAGGKLRQLMTAQEQRLSVQLIAAHEKKKDYKAAARAYERFGDSATDAAQAEKAYASAIGNALLINDQEAATRVVGIWRRRFPKSTGWLDQSRRIATILLIRGSFKESAKQFEALGIEMRDSASLLTAAEIYEAVGDAAHGEQAWSQWLKMFGAQNQAETGRIHLALGRIQERANKESVALRSYQLCQKSPVQVLRHECATKAADLYLRARDFDAAQKVFRGIAAEKGGVKGAWDPYVGYARFKTAELIEQKMELPELGLPKEKLERALASRLKSFEVLSRSYSEAAEASGPFAIAALHRVATWTLRFADDIDAIAPMPGSDAEGIKRFRAELQSVSLPLRKKAIDTWQQAYRRAQADEILSSVLPEIGDRIADLGVAQPPRAQGFRGKFKLSGISSDGGETGRASALEKVRERLLKNPRDTDAWVDYGNLLWGEGQAKLARLAYAQALALDPKSAAALNNAAVALLTSEGAEQWAVAYEALERFKSALRDEPLSTAAKFNLASLYAYYRLHDRARPLWDQVVAKSPIADAYDGLAIASSAAGQKIQAREAFKKAEEKGAAKTRFARQFHEATWVKDDCLEHLDSIEGRELTGFLQDAAYRLRRFCESRIK